MSGDSNALEVVTPPGAVPIVYDVTEDAIAELRARFASLSCATPAGYEETRVAIGTLRGLRTAIEARRKALKDPALEYGRAVDARAKELTAKIIEIEDPLQAAKKAVDDEEARQKRAREEAELVAREAALKAEREAEEARIKAEAAERERKLAEERAVFEAAKKKADEERAAAEARQREEQAKLDAQRAEVEAAARAVREREEAAARAEAEREEKARAEKEAAEAAERARVKAEEDAARAAAEAARLEALKPEIERVRAWAPVIRAFATEQAPTVDSPEAAEAIKWARGRLEAIAAAIERFTPNTKGAK